MKRIIKPFFVMEGVLGLNARQFRRCLGRAYGSAPALRAVRMAVQPIFGQNVWRKCPNTSNLASV